ncbi:MAG: fatty acyl-AMP ligase [Prochloraceae cyanobacterium]
MSFSEKNLHLDTLVDLLSYRAEHQPEKIGYTFLVDGENDAVCLTYKELELLALAIAAKLQTIARPGDRVLLLYPPGLEYIAAFFGCLFAGIIAVPAYPPRPNRSSERIQRIIANAGVKIALTTNSIKANLERCYQYVPELKNLKLILSDRCSKQQATNWQKPKLDGDSLAFLQYTSGSTAEPKGVAIAHSNLMHNLESIYRCFEHDSNSKGAIWLPPYHDMGSIGGGLQPLYGGFPVILMSPLMFLQNPLRWLQAISRHRATTSGGPNFAYDLCVRKIKPEQLKDLDLSSWKVAFNGAEPIDYQVIAAFSEYFAPTGFRPEAFYPCYGMAEATLLIAGIACSDRVKTRIVKAAELEFDRAEPASFEDEDKVRQLVSCGRSIQDQKIVIVDPETSIEKAEGEIGEIWVKGPSIAQGYWQQPEATAKNFAAYLADTQEGPFLRTGDLGFMAEGELYCTGRLKDIIILNGRNYYPQDIEKTVAENHPQIRPHCSAVFSFIKDGQQKLAIASEIERSYYRSQKTNINANNGNFSPAELIKSIRKVVFTYHELQLDAAILLKPGSIPKTPSGKIQRYATRAGFLNGTLEAIE